MSASKLMGAASVLTASAAGTLYGCGGQGRKIVCFPGGQNPGALQGVTFTLNHGELGGPQDMPAAGQITVDVDFTSFDLAGLTPGGTYYVGSLPAAANFTPGGVKTAQTFNVAPPYAIPTAAPALATDGFAALPGWQTIQISLFGTGQTITLWVRTPSGNWRQAEQIAIAADFPTVTARQVQFGGGRFYLQAGAGGAQAEIDVEALV